MQWPRLEKILENIEIPKPYSVDYISESEIDELIEKISAWYPVLKTGSESCHLEADFYRNKVHLKEVNEPREVLAVVVKAAGEIVALYSVGADWRANWLGGKLTVIAPEHRNSQLGLLCVVIFERVGRLVGSAMIWVTSTLQHPYTQKLMEKCGFELCGIIPAWDRDVIDGKSKYVTEALYVKVLVDAVEVEEIKNENLTEKTRFLHTFLNQSRNVNQ